MASRDESVSNRKWLSRSSGQGAPRHKGGQGEDMIQDSNEYGERYEWITKSKSTATVRRENINSRRQCTTEMTELVKRSLMKKRGSGDFHVQHGVRSKTVMWLRHVPESGEDADDEESTWSPNSPRPPQIPEADEEMPTTLHTAETCQNMSHASESRNKCSALIPTEQKVVQVRKSKSQVPMRMVSRKINKRQSLPSVENCQLRREQSGKHVEPGVSRNRDIHRVASHSSNTLSASSVDSVSSSPSSGAGYPHRDNTHSGLKIRLLSGTDRARCEAYTNHRELHPGPEYASPVRTRLSSSPVLQLSKSVVYEQGKEPSTTISFKGHVPPDLLNEIFFGRRGHSCPCWPQYDVEHHIGCMSLSDHNYGHLPARPALSDQGRKFTSPTRSSEIDIYYASPTRRRGERAATAYTPEERRRQTLVHLRSEPVVMHVVGERPHRVNSPALRRSLEASRRSSRMHNPVLISTRRDRAMQSSTDTIPARPTPTSSNNHLQGNRRSIIILK